MQVCGIDRKSRRWWMRLFTFMLDLTTVNAYIIYLHCFKIVHSPAMVNEKPLTLTEFRAEVVTGLVGTYSCRKQSGRPNARYKSPILRSPGHKSCNLVRRNILKRGCCDHCCNGVQRAQRKETSYGCLECCKRLCPDKCHDEYHCILFQNKEE